jgi:hypothetical protein
MTDDAPAKPTRPHRPAWHDAQTPTSWQRERERCIRIAEEERDSWLTCSSGYAAANLIVKKIRGEL